MGQGGEEEVKRIEEEGEKKRGGGVGRRRRRVGDGRVARVSTGKVMAENGSEFRFHKKG